MDDQEMEQWLRELKDTWRVTGDPPLDRMWQFIEAEGFAGWERGSGGRWIRKVLPLAATLILGFGLGQLTPGLLRPHAALRTADGSSAEPGVQPARWTDDAPFVGVATNYLERVTALLVTLTEESNRGQPLDYSSGKARDLLATTRLLLDSPQLSDPHLRDLLDDLELVLAQIARLPREAAPPDVYLIDQALDQREVLPRLRGLLAENSPSEP
jgi:hypothetical protein